MASETRPDPSNVEALNALCPPAAARLFLALLRLRRHINHLALRGVLVQHGPNRRDGFVKLFVGHAFKALGVLHLHLPRHQQRADFDRSRQLLLAPLRNGPAPPGIMSRRRADIVEPPVSSIISLEVPCPSPNCSMRYVAKLRTLN